MLNNVNLSDVRSFVLIAQLGNFTKAAEALQVSRSHVSRQISALEAEIGVSLLTRTTRTLRLTQAGEAFYAQCEGALNEIDQALIAAVDDTNDVRGLIRVNCVGGYIGEEIIAPYISEFMALYPEINIHLDFSSHRIDLIEDQFDIAFRMGQLENAGFIARKLMDINMVTLASPKYIQNHGLPLHPKDLNQHQCLTGSVKKWRFLSLDDSTQHYEVTIDGHLLCKNGNVLITGALHNNGIIRVPEMYCKHSIECGELVEIFPNWKVPNSPFSAIYHKDKYQPKRLRALIGFVTTKFEHDDH